MTGKAAWRLEPAADCQRRQQHHSCPPLTYSRTGVHRRLRRHRAEDSCRNRSARLSERRAYPVARGPAAGNGCVAAGELGEQAGSSCQTLTRCAPYAGPGCRGKAASGPPYLTSVG